LGNLFISIAGQDDPPLVVAKDMRAAGPQDLPGEGGKVEGKAKKGLGQAGKKQLHSITPVNCV